MITQSPCRNCDGEIEYDLENWTADTAIDCPHCGQSTKLKPPVKAMVSSRRPMVHSNLTTCPSCGARVSAQAFACPGCGHQFKNPGGVNLKDPVHVIGLGICVLIILSVIVGIIYAATIAIK